jgi:hypothetical protein
MWAFHKFSFFLRLAACESLASFRAAGFFFGLPPFLPLAREAADFTSDFTLPPFDPDWQAKCVDVTCSLQQGHFMGSFYEIERLQRKLKTRSHAERAEHSARLAGAHNKNCDTAGHLFPNSPNGIYEADYDLSTMRRGFQLARLCMFSCSPHTSFRLGDCIAC